jgi:succinylarginine dihydrolase
MSFEVNFDGLVGPTHNYSGLSSGNLASMGNASQISNPQEAALEGLKKMGQLLALGLKQAVFPPQDRPSIYDLRRLGFSGSDAEVLKQAAAQPLLLASHSSASCMWTANAGTVAPRTDTADGKSHFTAANLVSKLHRSIEALPTARMFQAIFANPKYFTHHAPLPATEALGDEGAANHTRLAPRHQDRGLHLFVYGRSQFGSPNEKRPTRFAARQTREASESIARLHGLSEAQTVFAQQNPDAIDAGVFHNDVISVGNGSVFFFHEKCFASPTALEELQRKWSALHPGIALTLLKVTQNQVSMADAVSSYLFNSQLVSLPSGKMALIAPGECETTPAVKQYLDEQIQSGGPISQVLYPQLRQSMKNGGGPACLRSRVVLSDEEIRHCSPGVFLDPAKLTVLENWVKKHYRDRLAFADLADPQLLRESRTALDELTRLLGLGSIYTFQ